MHYLFLVCLTNLYTNVVQLYNPVHLPHCLTEVLTNPSCCFWNLKNKKDVNKLLNHILSDKRAVFNCLAGKTCL